MKPLGIVRHIDELGRVVVPKEIRRAIGVKEGDEMEIFATNKGVYFQKYDPADENTPDIFKEMGFSAVPAQPPVAPDTRKRIIFHDKEDEKNYYITLTPKQIALLEWLETEYILDEDRYGWEVLNNEEFEEI